MASRTFARLTEAGPLTPAMGTVPSAANQYFPKGTIVTVNSSGDAVSPGTADASAFPAVGVSKASYDNRTGAEAGGLAGSLDVEVDFGIHAFDFTGTTPTPGKVLFIVDNQTLNIDSNSGARGIAGYCSEVRGTQVYCLFGPTVAGQIVIAASEASQLDTAQANITALQVDAATTQSYVFIPLTSFVDADGDPLAKFVNASSPTFGYNLADSEAMCLRWNNDATPGTALCQVAIPFDLDDTAAATLEFLCSKSGATVGDATTLTITAFLLVAGDLHDADANAGGVTNALVGNATAKTTAVLSRTIAAADIQPNSRSMTFTVTPTAGTLGTDDLLIHSVRLHYTKKILTS